MSNTERVNLFVDPDTKTRWEEYAEEDPEVDGNLSRLIRLAVNREVSGAHNRDTGTGATQEHVVMEAVAELADKMDHMNDTLNRFEGRLNTLEAASRQDPDLDALSNEVFSLLPTADEFEEWHGLDHPEAPDERGQLGNYPPEDHAGLRAERGGDPKALAEVLDAAEYRVHEALVKLMENTHLVREREVDGESRYLKEA